MGTTVNTMRPNIPTLLLALLTIVSGLPHPIPKVNSSFCDNNIDFRTDSSGGSIGANFSYRLCMDVAGASSRLECLGPDVPCPAGPETHLSIFTQGNMYTIDYTGNCTVKLCPGCAPPTGLPFSFLLIDGADGDKSRGVASYKGQVQMDGMQLDHFAHDRGEVVKGMGVMNWYLHGNDLMRTAYVFKNTTGNRDLSQHRVQPAPAASFTVPTACASTYTSHHVSNKQAHGNIYGDSF